MVHSGAQARVSGTGNIASSMSAKATIDGVQGAALATYSDEERSEMLDRTQWASEFNWHEIQTLARFMLTYKADKGAVLIHEGDTTSYLCLIVAGSVSVVKGEPPHDIKHLARLGPGKTFGEMALIDAGPRSASVVARKATLLLVLTEDGFDALTMAAPRLAVRLLRKVARMVTERLRMTTGALSEYLDPIDTGGGVKPES